MDDYKFTKGKWNIFIDNIIKSEIFIMVGKIPIVRIALNNYLNEKEAKANALLISKSPILLQAIYDSIKPLKDAGLKEMADYHEKIYIESIDL